MARVLGTLLSTDDPGGSFPEHLFSLCMAAASLMAMSMVLFACVRRPRKPDKEGNVTYYSSGGRFANYDEKAVGVGVAAASIVVARREGEEQKPGIGSGSVGAGCAGAAGVDGGDVSVGCCGCGGRWLRLRWRRLRWQRLRWLRDYESMDEHTPLLSSRFS